jgi:hypothetical protein
VLRAWWPAAGLGLLAFTGLTFTRADADLWGHLRFGFDILRDWELPSVDPYSFTQDKPWVNHEWLSELTMALAVTAFGYAGIPLLKGLLAGLTLFIAWQALREARLAVRLIVAGVLLAGTIHATASLRPQLWTFLFLAIECRLLASDEQGNRWCLPLLMGLWVNVHGGWIVGMGVLGVWAGVQLLVTDRRREWTAIVAASGIATLANPYGWGLWHFIATTVRMERSIDEWQPLWTLPATHWVPWLISVTSVVWASTRSFPQKWSVLAVLAMLAYSAARVQRLESMFVLSAAVLLAPTLSERWPRRIPRLSFPRPFGEGVIAACSFVVLLAVSASLASRTLDCVAIRSPWSPDLDAAPWLESAHPGRLVTHFNWGQYAIWHFGPRLRVSMDGRRETVYTDARLIDHVAISEGTDEGLSLLQQWQPEYIWLPQRSQRTREWLSANGYRLDFNGPSSFVASRRDLPALAPPAEAARPCFPG